MGILYGLHEVGWVACRDSQLVVRIPGFYRDSRVFDRDSRFFTGIMGLLFLFK